MSKFTETLAQMSKLSRKQKILLGGAVVIVILAIGSKYANANNIVLPPPPEQPPVKVCDCGETSAGIAAFAAIDFVGDGTFQTGVGAAAIGSNTGFAGAAMYSFGKGIYSKVGVFTARDNKLGYAGAIMLSW